MNISKILNFHISLELVLMVLFVCALSYFVVFELILLDLFMTSYFELK